MSHKIERRYIKAEGMDLEMRGEGEAIVRGHAAVFNVLSGNLGGFREKIAPGFFDPMLTDTWLKGEEDCKSLFNHDPNELLGRTNNGTLRLSADKKGLLSETDLIDTSAGRDCLLNVKTKRVTQMSFAFTLTEDHWAIVDGENIRTLVVGHRLYDTSPVTYPAYPATDIGARSLLNATKYNFAPLLSAVVRAEHGLACTKDDVAEIKNARQLLNKIIEAAEPQAPKGRSVASLKELKDRLNTLK